jgi:hypothetical protein
MIKYNTIICCRFKIPFCSAPSLTFRSTRRHSLSEFMYVNRLVRVMVAANPDEKVSACLALSSDARQDSRQSRVGFPPREYSYLQEKHLTVNYNIPKSRFDCSTKSQFSGNSSYIYFNTLHHYSLSVICRRVLLEGGGERDLGHDGHRGPLFRLLSHVTGLGSKVGVVGAVAVAGHLEAGVVGRGGGTQNMCNVYVLWQYY